MILWLLGVAFAQEPCAEALTTPPERLAVAWVSPVRQRTGRRGMVRVVQSAELQAWVTANRPTVGRLLQHVGERKRSKEPRGRYKVVVFDVSRDLLCRPLDGIEGGTLVDGVVACDRARSNGRYGGCGVATDLATGKRGPEVYEIAWRDAAARGFCVVPAQRYVDEAGR